MERGSCEMTDKPIHISPTQLAAYTHPQNGCPRKWGRRYLDGIREPDSVGKTFGTELHSRIENYLRTAAPIGDDDIGQAVRTGMRPGFLPTPKTGLILEEAFEVPQDGFMLTGKSDCISTIDRLMICDWKGTKDKRYIITPEDLRDDCESIIYSAVAMARFAVDRCLNRWVYFIAQGNERPRKAQGCVKIEIDRGREETQKQYNALMVTAAEMVAFKKAGATADDMAANPRACDAYGGCPHRAWCNLPVRGRFLVLLSEDKKYLTHCANSDRVPQSTALAAHNRGGITMPQMDLLAKLRAKDAGATKVPAQSPLDKLKALQAAKGAKGVNPPAQAPAQAPAQVPGKKMTLAQARASMDAKRAEADKAIGAVTAPAQAPAQAPKPFTADQKGKAVIAAQSAADRKAVSSDKAEDETTPNENFVLCIDCTLRKGEDPAGPAVSLNDFLHEKMVELERAADVGYWTLVPGAGVELARFAGEKAKTFRGVVVMHSNTEEGIAVRSVLERHAVAIYGMAL